MVSPCVAEELFDEQGVRLKLVGRESSRRWRAAPDASAEGRQVGSGCGQLGLGAAAYGGEPALCSDALAQSRDPGGRKRSGGFADGAVDALIADLRDDGKGEHILVERAEALRLRVCRCRRVVVRPDLRKLALVHNRGRQPNVVGCNREVALARRLESALESLGFVRERLARDRGDAHRCQRDVERLGKLGLHLGLRWRLCLGRPEGRCKLGNGGEATKKRDRLRCGRAQRSGLPLE